MQLIYKIFIKQTKNLLLLRQKTGSFSILYKKVKCQLFCFCFYSKGCLVSTIIFEVNLVSVSLYSASNCIASTNDCSSTPFDYDRNCAVITYAVITLHNGVESCLAVDDICNFRPGQQHLLF